MPFGRPGGYCDETTPTRASLAAPRGGGQYPSDGRAGTDVTFLWPDLLWLLAVVPLLVLAYWLLLRRKKQVAVRYASLAMVKDAMGAGQRFAGMCRRSLFLASLTLMIVAIARPQAVVTLPSQHETIILAMDVSGSMRAADVEPNRLVAAQNAARAFVNDQPQRTRVGIVSFAGTAAVVQPPTKNREDIIAAIDRFQLQRGTAVGSGILVSLKTMFPDAEFDLRSWNPRGDRQKSGPLDRASRRRQAGGEAGAARVLHVGGDHPADRRPDDDRSRPDRVGTHGGGARRARVHRRRRHAEGRDDRRRRLVDARAPRRSGVEADRQTSRRASTSTPVPRPT